MRFSSTHAPPMVISTSCNTDRCSVDLVAKMNGAGSTSSTALPAGAGAMPIQGTLAGRLA